MFISHCGNQGLQEAKYHGVPILGIPVTFDQPRNAARMDRKGFGIKLSWKNLTPEKVVDAINKITSDKR